MDAPLANRPPRVFISYSQDSPAHKARVRALADRLRGDRVDCTIDQYEPHPKEPWPRWMDRQLEQADFVLVVGTETYLRRASGHEEPGKGRGATFESVLITQDLYDAGMWNERFVPVLFDGASPEHVPRPLRGYKHYRVDTEEGYEELYRHLTGQPRIVRPDLGEFRRFSPEPGPTTLPGATVTPASGGVASCLRHPPKLPSAYQARVLYLEPLKRALLTPSAKPIGISGAGMVGLQGMGGIGKTVLAAAVAWDAEVKGAFPDGVFWFTVGQQPDLVGLLRELAGELGDREAVFTSLFQAKRRVSELAAGKRLLLVLDDVWDLAHAETLDAAGPDGRLLLTTRDREILLRLGVAEEVQVDVLDPDEALEFLAGWSGQPSGSPLHPVARQVAKECGYLPLALAMIGAMVHLRPTAWEDALARLRRAEIEKIRGQFPDYPYPSVLRALEVSVEALEPWQRERYLECAVFPEDAAVSEAAVATLWSAAGLPEDDAHDLVATLVARSLATRDAAGHLTLHDLQGDYLRKRTGDLRPLHRRLVEAYARRCEDGFPSGRDDGYFFQRLPHHLVAAGMDEELSDLLFGFRWLEAKLAATDVNAVMADYEHLADRPAAQLVQGALRLGAHVLARDPGQLPSQLQGRLAADQLLEVAKLLTAAGRHRATASLRPLRPSLTAPGGALLRILEGHTRAVWAVARLDERRMVTASGDRTLRVWDVENGATLTILKGHTGAANAVARLDERRVVSASDDRTLCVWDVESGATLATLKGHTGAVWAVARLDERRVVSASDDRTLRVWDVESGATLVTLQGHTGGVTAVARLDERRVVSASGDRTLRVWDVESGATLSTLEGHTGSVRAVARLGERSAVSACADRTLRIWDVDSGAMVATLKGHTDSVNAAARLDERRVVSASSDHTLRVWDVDSGTTLATLESHTGAVWAVTQLDERRVVSASDDRTLRIWDVDSGATLVATLQGHTGAVQAVARLDERRVVSASDGTLRVWDVESGTILATLGGCADLIIAVAGLDERRVVTASYDHMLRVWDLDSGAMLATLKGHTESVYAVARLDERRVVSASFDGTLRVWDVDSGAILSTLKGHADRVVAVARLDERRVVSASYDHTLRVWDVESGAMLSTLEGHAYRVTAVARLDDRRAVSASDDHTLCVWDVESGVALVTLKGHTGAVTAVARLDERRAVSASDDCTLRVWDVESGATVAIFTLDALATTVDVIPERKLVAAGDRSGRLHFLVFEEPATS